MDTFNASDPVKVDNLRKQLENKLFVLVREIAAAGLVPTVTLHSRPVMGEYEVEVAVRYGKAFYRSPEFAAFISQRMKADAALESGHAPDVG